MNDEQQFNEIEKTMFDLSGACRRARKTIVALEKAAAPEHLVDAMRMTLTEMEASHKRLMQGTYWAVPEMRTSAAPEQQPAGVKPPTETRKRFVPGSSADANAQTTLL
jgi:hypothetical protein